MRCRYSVVLIVVILATLTVSAYATDYTVANGARANASAYGDPAITVGVGWTSTTQSPPAFFWSGDPAFDSEGAFTFTAQKTTLLNVTDDFCPGDQFRVYDFGTPIGDTPPVAISYTCAVLGPAAASANPAYSHRTFVLGPGGHSITLQTITNPFGGGRAYLRVDLFNGSIDLLDPISSLLSGDNVISDPLNPAFISNTVIKRAGIAADGVAKLVVRFNAPSAGTARFTLVDAQGDPLVNDPENGSLNDLSGGSLLDIPTSSTLGGEEAFAIYTAPTRFVRSAFPNDAGASQRQVFIHVTFAPWSGTSNSSLMQSVAILRPLVFLVHGIWSCQTSWINFEPLLSDTRFTIKLADYRDPPPGNACVASQGFAVDAATVFLQLVADVAQYRQANNVSALQADVVTHSMGAPVVRSMTLQPSFLHYGAFPTLGHGPIHKLITIAGLHTGTPLANYLLNSACLTTVFSFGLGKPTGNGAVSDLQVGSAAIKAIDAKRTPFPTSTIVGLASAEEILANDVLFGTLVNSLCSNPIPTFEFNLVLGTTTHDLLVPESSQNGGRSETSNTVNSVVHSSPFLTPSGTQELNTSAIASLVTTLLNANADDTTVFAPF
jgi:pimeloyl-ACP methyl ester carboxylesterase